MKKLIKLSQSISKFVVGAEGNISQKVNDIFYIKASGTSCSNITKKDLIKCDLKGTQLNNFDKKPSMEIGFHTWLLSLPNINFVCHTHPINTLKILCTDHINVFAGVRLFPDQIIYNNKYSCVVPYVNPGTDLIEVIKHNVNEYIKDMNEIPKLILLQNHGIICIGETYQQCVVATEICEKSAEIYIGANQLGSFNYINQKNIIELDRDENELYRKNVLKLNI